MKKIIYILPVIILVACSDITDLNKNKKDPASVLGETLFTSAQKELVDQVVETSVNYNIFRLIMQYWTETTYTDESNYELISRNIPGTHWIVIYRDGLKDLSEAYKVTQETSSVALGGDAVKSNRLAIIEIMTVYGYSLLINTFGDVPYSEALDTKNLLPKYDDGLTVYKDLLARLNAAIGQLDGSAASFSAASDNMYQGSVAGWIKFANSMKLGMGILISDIESESALARETVEEAVAAGVFSSSADNADLEYLMNSPNTHPVHANLVLSGRKDYVAGKTTVDAMTKLNDPRIGKYFSLAADKTYKGGIIGAINSYIEYSHVHTDITKADAKGVVMTYSEVEFLLAEAAARGYSVGGSVEEHYAKAIRASIKYWGGSDNDANAYLAQNAVAYATAEGSWKQKIGTQSWLALYNRGYEAWTSWRRLDYPKLVEPAAPVSETPVRLTYPVAEQTLNEDNRAAAAEKIGGDDVETKLFWDVN